MVSSAFIGNASEVTGEKDQCVPYLQTTARTARRAHDADLVD